MKIFFRKLECNSMNLFISYNEGRQYYWISMNYIRNYHIIGKVYGCIHAEKNAKNIPFVNETESSYKKTLNTFYMQCIKRKERRDLEAYLLNQLINLFFHYSLLK